jgi:Tol biopolymer transport system component
MTVSLLTLLSALLSPMLNPSPAAAQQGGRPSSYGGPPGAEELSMEEIAAKEAKHLKNIRQVTFGFAKAGEGYFSPDGKAIIFQAARWPEPTTLQAPAEGWDAYQIYTAELTPGAEPKLVSTGKGKCTCAYFHPDGQSILFASSHLDPAIQDESAAADRPEAPAYSRSERYAWDFDPHMDIFRANPDGSGLERLTDAEGYDAEGSYSPDGSQIVFTSFRDGDADIYVMDADGSNVRQITNEPGYDGGPFFSPDGKSLIYRSDREQNDLLQIFINTVDGRNERQLTDNEHVNWGPFFHADGRHLVYSTSEQGHFNYEVFMLDVETGEKERITYYPGFDGLPVFNADGTKMMWTAKGRTTDSTSQLFIADFVLEPEGDEAP